MWLNAPEGSDEQKEAETKMDICLKELKKANKDAVNRSRIDYGANVLSPLPNRHEKGTEGHRNTKYNGGLMKYNSKYDRWVTKGGLIYRYDKKNDRLVQCKLTTMSDGYTQVSVSKPKRNMVLVHRLVYETFVDEIPIGYQIDHINTIRDDNRIENFRCVTPKENMNNPLSRKHLSESLKGRPSPNKGNIYSEETRKKISEAQKGRIAWNKGKHHTEETRKKISEANKGKNNPMYGKHHSEETRKKIGEAANKVKSLEPRSEFGRKFKEHYGITKCKNTNLYEKERQWYLNHNNKCRWEDNHA